MITRLSALLCALAVVLTSGSARAGEADVALTVLDFDKVSSDYDQAQIRIALVGAFGKRLLPAAIAEPNGGPVEHATDDRGRIQIGKHYGARLLVEASIFHGPPPRGGPPQWVAELSLFDSEGGEYVGSAETTCADCSLDAFRAKFGELAARLLKNDRLRPTTRLIVKDKPSVVAKIKIDNRPMGYLPFDETLFVGQHQIAVEADGYRPAQIVVVLQQGAPEEIVLPLERLDAQAQGNVTPSDRYQVVPWRDGQSQPHAGSSSPTLRVVGGIGLGLGVGALVAGSVLLGIDGDASCTLTGIEKRCPGQYSTTAGGAVLVAGGLVAVAGGIVALIIDHRHRHKASLNATSDIGPGQMLVGVGGGF